MAYIKTDWEDGDVISEAGLDHLENGVYNNSVAIGDLTDLDTTDKTNLVAAINEAAQSGGGSGMSNAVKDALLQIASKVAYIDADGQDYYDDLYDALYPAASIVSIQADYTQTGTVYTTTSLEDLRNDLVVNAIYDNGSVVPVISYTLSGTLEEGTSTITVTYEGLTDTFDVEVTAAPTLSSISAVYTQSGTVYDTDSLDSLKSDLVVTATYSDSSTATVPSADYTLSGTLTVGTSTITVSYGGKTTTFNVTVTEGFPYVSNGLFAYWDAIDNTGSSHDATATTWVDVINGYTWEAMVTNGTKTWSWDADALVFAPASTGKVTTNGTNAFTCPRIGTGLRTLEVVFTPTDTTAAQCLGEFTADSTNITDSTTQIIGLIGSDSTFITYAQQNGFVAGSLGNIKSISATYNSSYAPAKAYMNGSEVTTRGTSHSFKEHYNSGMLLGTQNQASGYYPIKGKIHAIRFYNRELSDSEIAQNYAADVARFNLT